MSRTLDFDQARRDRRAPVALRAFGRDWTVPGSQPVAFSLLFDQYRESKGEGTFFTRTETYDLLRAAVGEDNFDGLVEAGLSEDDVWPLIVSLSKRWRGLPDGEEEDEEGEAPAPEEGAGSAT